MAYRTYGEKAPFFKAGGWFTVRYLEEVLGR